MSRHTSSASRKDSGAGTGDKAMPARAGWQAWSGWGGFGLLLLFLLMRFVVMVQPRAMEFDQICTLITAQAQSWSAYLAALPIDSQPPLSHLAARIGMALPLRQSVGVHLFSALSIGFAAFCLFRLFQRRGAPLAGLCSAAMFTASRCVEFMFTVRPYAALMAVSAAPVLVYDTYRRRRSMRRDAPVWPVVAVILVAATVHALGLLYVLTPIVLGEGYEWLRSRRVDWRLLLASGCASCAFVFDVALARRVQGQTSLLLPMSARTPGLPTMAKLHEVLTFPIERHWQVAVFAVVLGMAAFLARGAQRDREPAGLDEDAVSTTPLFLSALAIYVAACLAFAAGALSHYFYTRYASPVFVAGALALGAALSTRGWRQLPRVQLVLAIVLVLLPLPSLLAFFRAGPHLAPQQQFASLYQHGQLIASPLAYPTLWWYATPEQRMQLRLLTDAHAFQKLSDGIPEATLRSFASVGLLPFPLTPLRDSSFGPTVYLVAPGLSGDTWVPAYLRDQGYTCTPDASFQSDAYALTRCIR